MRILTKLAFSALLSALLFGIAGTPEAARAATNSAEVSITVSSATYADAISSANVTLQSASLPFPVTIKTNTNGIADFHNVPVGDYSVTVSSATYDPSGSISIGTLSAGQSYTQQISLISNPSLMGIAFFNAYNNSSSAGTYEGSVSWSTYGPIPDGSEMKLQYLDDSDAPVGPVTSSVFYSPASTDYSIDVTNAAIPAGAKRIGVTVLNSDSSVIAFQSTALLNWSSHAAQAIAFNDSNANGGAFSASVTWSKANDESALAGYRIYYETKDMPNYQYWDVVKKHTDGSSTYQYTFSALPTTDTVAILIGADNSRGEELSGYPEAFVVDNRLADTVPAYSPNVLLPVPSGMMNYNYTNDFQTISGSISWSQPADRSQIKGYDLYFSDANGDRLQAIGTISTPYNANATIFYDLGQSIPIKSGATQLAIYTLGLDGKESQPVYVPFNYSPYGTRMPNNLRFADLDAQANQLRGYLMWTKAADESAITGYDAYFLNRDYNKTGALIGEAMKGSATVLALPAGLAIPTGADKIGLFVKDLYGNLSLSSVYYLFTDSKSQTDVAAGIKASYFQDAATVNVGVLSKLLLQAGGSSPFAGSDIELFLSLIDARKVNQ